MCAQSPGFCTQWVELKCQWMKLRANVAEVLLVVHQSQQGG